ncbi:MAG TPA: carbohydrate binding family 9 domain-containing protein [Gammaproteobacteria bacterium]|nr:carbohydrate binding family 9 domain-containing protein [Gammaproteobacteria bacterium]
MLELGRWGLLFAFFAGTALAQEPVALRDPGQKSVRMVRTATPPVIDGRLDDAAWANAALVDDLHQTAPVEYAEPEERTEIYLLYDDDALYIGARLYDNDPENITAQNLRQNDSIAQDDRFYVTLDPFYTRRSGYFFGVNPNGVRNDGLYQNVADFYSAWDSIFYAQTGRFEEGWIAEMAIPFKSLSFDPSTDTWGLNFSRGIVRKNENLAWVSRNRQYNPSIAGTAVGFEGLEQGIGLDVVPSLSINSHREFSPALSESDAEPSLDLVYKLTPAMNASLTFNTDFSATEVDDRQVNLTRFGLFFPEKRDFFLREADIFEFGRIGAQGNNIGISRVSRENGRPFFSRRIGLSNSGELVDLEYGAKISGRVGRWELGALSIRQDQFNAVDAETLSVVRAKVGVLDESSLGVVVTDGDPRSNLGNSLAGMDFFYRNTRLPGGRSLEADFWHQRSDTEGLEGEDGATGVGFRIPSATGFRGGVSVKELERNFNPALGFIDRRDVRDYASDLGFTYRPLGRYLQSIFVGVNAQRIEQLDGGLQSQSVAMPFELINDTADAVMLVAKSEKDVLRAPFAISPGVTIPAGDYSFADFGAELRTGNHRKFAGLLRIIDGDFYDGRRKTTLGELTWRPSARFRTSVSYDYNEITLPQGDFETRLVRLGFDIVFSSTLSWVNLIQYDNVTETMGVNMRLHWIPQAGRELFFVINQNLEDFDRDDSFHSVASDVTAKMNYTFRF